MLSKSDYNILKLIRSKNVGASTFFKLLNFFGSCENAIENIEEFNKKYKNKNPIILAKDDDIEKEIVGCSTIGAKIITYQNSLYPKLLKYIYTFPPVLTVLGNVELLNKKSISIVGSRNASSNGRAFAKRIAEELGNAGYVITSGFASGIDTASHWGALKTGTIAVLGGGVDDIYPRGNEDLYYEIKNKGLIISENPFNSAPKAENFPSRNRIVSGLSEGVIIIEASSRSGTLHTARQALEQGRELMVAPGNPYDYRCEGSNKLIKDGANPITSSEDILYLLENFSIKNNGNDLSLSDKENIYSEDENNIDLNNKEENELLDDDNDLPIKDKILSRLNHTPINIEDFSIDLKIPINILNSQLIELEMDGKVVVENGFVSIKD